MAGLPSQMVPLALEPNALVGFGSDSALNGLGGPLIGFAWALLVVSFWGLIGRCFQGLGGLGLVAFFDQVCLGAASARHGASTRTEPGGGEAAPSTHLLPKRNFTCPKRNFTCSKRKFTCFKGHFTCFKRIFNCPKKIFICLLVQQNSSHQCSCEKFST